jgi:hypothetical protein
VRAQKSRSKLRGGFARPHAWVTWPDKPASSTTRTRNGPRSAKDSDSRTTSIKASAQSGVQIQMAAKSHKPRFGSRPGTTGLARASDISLRLANCREGPESEVISARILVPVSTSGLGSHFANRPLSSLCAFRSSNRAIDLVRPQTRKWQTSLETSFRIMRRS